MESSSVVSFDHLLEKTRLPQPSFQRLAVSTLFQKLRSASSGLALDSDPARDALSRCIASASAPVADQAIRELCRLVKDGTLPTSIALLELQSALEGCPPGFVPLFVKGIGFLVRFAFRADPSWARRFDPVELHPFVKVHSCRVETHQELIHQVLLFMVQNRSPGMEAVSGFLRPFLLFSILRTSSFSYSSFIRDLISLMASVSCSFPSESIGILKLLVGCLKYFPHANDKESKCMLVSAEYLIDALLVVLKQMNSGAKMNNDAKACCIDLLENLLAMCIIHNKPWGATEIILELSKRLLVAMRELGLPYLPELVMVTVSVAIILTQVEFEHEHLSALKLLTFINDWKNENDNSSEGIACYHGEELLCIFPLINLLSSPSGHVKASASHILSRITRLVLDLSINPRKVLIPPETSYTSLGSILLRLLRRLWFQEQACSPCSFFIQYASNCSYEDKEICRKTISWTSHLIEYLPTIARQKFSSMTQWQEGSSGGLTSLLSSVSSALLLHPNHSMSAVDSLAAIGAKDPKMGVPLLLIVLFHSKMLYRDGYCSPKILLRLLEILPSLASHSTMVPLILQTMLPMLHKNAELVSYSTAVRLLCKTWVANDFAFGTLQGILEPKAFSRFISQREICISLAASVRDVCSHNADRGVDLILSISSSIESRDSVVHALGLESLAYLCEADVIDFYTAWDFISDHLLEYSIDPVVAHGLCILLRWGAMDAEVYSEASKNIIKILWEVGSSRRNESTWVKARAAAFMSLFHFEVLNIQEAIPEFKRRNLECLVSEDNVELLNAMEKLVVKILKFEHINRRRVLRQKRVAVHKVEKLLDVFPQAIFSAGKLELNELPGAALLTLVFTPKELNTPPTTKDLPKLHTAYENALLEILESLYVSRNIFIALLALQSWKPFMHRWLRAVVVLAEAKSSSKSDKSSKAANDILKRLCRIAAESIPRISSNVAFAIAALCMVLPSSAHMVVSSASEFLSKWLFEYEHEHRQWSAAISLGIVSTCFDVTDRKQRFEVINGLLKVLCSSKSYLAKGACGVALGFACQNLFNGTKVGGDLDLEGERTGIIETSLLQDIIGTLSVIICELCPSVTGSFKNLNDSFRFSGRSLSSELLLGDPNLEDVWGVAGLVLGLGYTVVALYHFGFYDAVIKIKDLLISWISYDSSRNGSLLFSELSDIPLCMGSSLVLPTVAAFCERYELANFDFDFLYGRYYSLISELLNLKKSGTIYENFLMASCIGAGSFLSCILNTGVHLVKFDDVKHLMEVLRTTYNSSYPHHVCFGGMLGVANAFGAHAGDLVQVSPQATILQLNYEQESAFISCPILSSPSCEMLSTSMVQEIFLIAKDSKDQQMKKYAAWALSFLRHQWWSSEFPNKIASQNSSIISNSQAQTFDEDSLVWKLCLWLRELNKNKAVNIMGASTVSTVLRCLSKAPKLPALDWGVIIRRCMRYDLHSASEVHMRHALASHRGECLNFCLSHASHVSSLLSLVDELSELPRFKTLELNMQKFLLEHLSNICKIFSGQRLEKLFVDLAEYFSDPSSSYLAYGAEKKILLRVAFWKGLHQCFRDDSKELIMISNAEKCLASLLSLLPISGCSGFSEEGTIGEWSVAIQCLSEAPKDWLLDLLQVPNARVHGERIPFVAKMICIKAKLVGIGCLTISDLAELKSHILNEKTEGVRWSMLIEVVAALLTAEGRVKRQWLLDAVEISCISEYPSTALYFVGLLSSGCCMYMPLLIADPTSVLSDLPVTLPSLMSINAWNTIAGTLVDKLWICTERICKWVKHLAIAGSEASTKTYHIDASEACLSVFLARVLHGTCLSLKEFLPFDKQLGLANLEEVL
ncbi:protein RST1 isoform X1 [Canna indica]|uniref:Protein RST1 isoform X1 n=1 Tax=Canna indica TaxID=4628 RepID=A0AAQ3KAN1_9LILI|nr:protein RST1 isoform X1 [Canna indica]